MTATSCLPRRWQLPAQLPWQGIPGRGARNICSKCAVCGGEVRLLSACWPDSTDSRHQVQFCRWAATCRKEVLRRDRHQAAAHNVLGPTSAVDKSTRRSDCPRKWQDLGTACSNRSRPPGITAAPQNGQFVLRRIRFVPGTQETADCRLHKRLTQRGCGSAATLLRCTQIPCPHASGLTRTSIPLSWRCPNLATVRCRWSTMASLIDVICLSREAPPLAEAMPNQQPPRRAARTPTLRSRRRARAATRSRWLCLLLACSGNSRRCRCTCVRMLITRYVRPSRWHFTDAQR